MEAPGPDPSGGGAGTVPQPSKRDDAEAEQRQRWGSTGLATKGRRHIANGENLREGGKGGEGGKELAGKIEKEKTGSKRMGGGRRRRQKGALWQWSCGPQH